MLSSLSLVQVESSSCTPMAGQKRHPYLSLTHHRGLLISSIWTLSSALCLITALLKASEGHLTVKDLNLWNLFQASICGATSLFLCPFQLLEYQMCYGLVEGG